MKLRIFQINMDRDNDHVCFLAHESLAKFQGSAEINSTIYDKVFDGDVNCVGLEDVYCMFNVNHPEDYKGRSLSVSDIVEVLESSEVEKGFYFCDSIGFREVKFEPEKTEDARIRFFEVCLSGDYSICIKGTEFPTAQEAENYLGSYGDLQEGQNVVDVMEINEQYARESFDFSNEKIWPVFNNKNK